MADTSYAYTPGTGGLASIDRVTGVDYPHYKVKWGPGGTLNDADIASGKPFPIQLRGSDGTDRSNNLPVTVTGTATVSGTVAATQSGSWTISGTVAVTQSGTWNVGTVTTVTSITNPVAATQSGTWTVQPGNTANTTPWLVSVSGTATVSGTVAATQSGTWNVGTLTSITNPVAATQSGAWSVRNQDGSGNSLTSALRGTERALSIQVVDASGNQITAFGGSGGTSSNFGSATPSAGTAVGFSDGTNMQLARVFDADTGGGTQYVQGFVERVPASGGSTLKTYGAGAADAGTTRVTIDTGQIGSLVNNSVPTVSGGFDYETVAASQTDQILGASGAVGDYLETLICVVTTAATSQVQIKDGNGSAITVLPNNVAGGIGTYEIAFGIKCVNSTTPGWKVTTAAGVSVLGTGDFT